MKRIKQIIYTLLTVCSFNFLSQKVYCNEPQNIYDKIIYNIVNNELSGWDIQYGDTKTEEYLKSITDNGSFPDINYKSTSQTNWAPNYHLDRMKYMALSYISSKSKYYGNSNLYDVLVKMLSFWYDSNPRSTNWYNQEIGWPQRMGLNLSILRHGSKLIPTELESKILKRMRDISKGPDQPGSQGSGANKMDIALQWIYRSVLQRDKECLDFSVQQFFYPLKFNEGEGLQSDYSYLQHGPQLYIGGYGESVLDATLKVAFLLTGTEYAQGEYLDYISNFIIKAYIPVIRGRYMLHAAIGRGMARKGGTDRYRFLSRLGSFKKIDPKNANIYDEAMMRIKGSKLPSYALSSYNRHFWRADYTLHQREGYTFDVRMVSKRTRRCENGNGENLKGYFVAEGATQMCIRGDEYLDIYPVWDWSRIPGTTTPSFLNVPQPPQWGQNGQSNFSGGVSDSIYGVASYQMYDITNNVNTYANKSWFMFDKMIVCMGSNINSSNFYPINTTVNQCLLKDRVQVLLDDEKSYNLDKGEHNISNIKCLNHDSISYYFPLNCDVTVRNDVQQGTWKSITSYYDNTLVKKDVLKIWMDHGIKPQNASYVYYIIPNTTNVNEAVLSMDDVQFINTDTLQAVLNKSLNILQVVFHKKGILKLGNIEMSVTEPCIAMFTSIDSENIKAYVSDPTYSRDSLSIYVKMPHLRYKKLLCEFNDNNLYRGSTHKFVLNKMSPDSIYVSVDSLALNKKNLELTYSKPYSQLQAFVYPDNATNKSVSWYSADTAVVQVNNNGLLMMRGQGKAYVKVQINNIIDSCLVTVNQPVVCRKASSDAYVYDGDTDMNYGKEDKLFVKVDAQGYNRRSFLKFPLTDDVITSETVIDSSKVVLYVTDAVSFDSDVNWRIYPSISTAWKENTITWATKPVYTYTLLLDTEKCYVQNLDVEENRFIDLNVHDFIQKQHAYKRKEVTFYIDQSGRVEDGKGTTSFASKENANAVSYPYIVYLLNNNNPDEIKDINNALVSLEHRKDEVIIKGCALSDDLCVYTLNGKKLRVNYNVTSDGNIYFSLKNFLKGIYIIKVSEQLFKIKI